MKATYLFSIMVGCAIGLTNCGTDTTIDSTSVTTEQAAKGGKKPQPPSCESLCNSSYDSCVWISEMDCSVTCWGVRPIPPYDDEQACYEACMIDVVESCQAEYDTCLSEC